MAWRPDRFSPGSVLRWANSIVSPIDRLACRNGDIHAHPVFVLGLPRSGTTLAYELIVQAFDVAYLTRAYAYSFGLPSITTRLVHRASGTPAPRYTSDYGRIPGWRSPAENHVLWERWMHSSPELGHYLPPGISDAIKLDAARRAVASITAIARRPFVFKDVYLTLSPRALLEFFPDAQIVVVERDFDAVCASVLQARMKRQHRGWWSIRPPFYTEMVEKDAVEKTAFQCSRARQLMARELSGIPESKCLRISYGEICNDPRESLRRIENWTMPSLRRTAGAQIPPSFERRESKRIPAGDADRFARLCDTLNNDAADYLQRVDRAAERLALSGAA